MAVELPAFENKVNPTTTTTTTTSSTGPSAAEGASKRNAEAGYRAILSQLGIPLSQNMMKLIGLAVRQGWNGTTFQFYLRKTKEYQQEFPGNVNRDGTINLSEASYISRAGQYKDAAAQIGLKIGPKVIATLIKKGISPTLFSTRAKAVKIMRNNGAVYQQFAEYIQAREGRAKPPTKKELLKYIAGVGPVKWDREWDNAWAASQIQEAGIDVGRPKEGADVSWKQLGGIVKRGDVDNADFAQLAFLAKHALPASKLHGMGIKPVDLVELAFGGPGAQNISDRVKQALGTFEAAVTEEPAHPQTVQSQSGSQMLTGRRPVQATE